MTDANAGQWAARRRVFQSRPSDAPAAPAATPARKITVEIYTLAALSAISFIPVALSDADSVRWQGAFVAFLLLLAASFFAWVELRREPWRFWTPMFSMRVNTAIFWGFGGLVGFLAPDDLLAFMHSFYPYTFADAAKAQAVVIVGYFVATFAASLIDGRHLAKAKPLVPPAGRGVDPLIWMLILAGLCIESLTIYNAVSQTAFVGLAGALVIFGTGLYAALFIGALQALTRRDTQALWIILAIAVTISAFGLMRFSKTAVLLPLLMVAAAWITARPTVFRVAAVVTSLVAIFISINAPTAESRNILSAEYRRDSAISVQDRAAIWQRAQQVADAKRELAGPNMNLARTSYTNTSSFAVARYDQGIPGNTFQRWWEVFVPRFIWPDKPVRQDGNAFNFEGQGFYESASSPGLSPEAYWNFGWGGVFVINLVFGLIMGFWGQFVRSVFAKGDWIFVPIVFVGMLFGSSTIQMFVASVLGTPPIVLGCYMCLSVLKLGLRR